MAALLAIAAPAIGGTAGGDVLQAQIRKTYPSLVYVDRYRATFPREAQGVGVFWAPNAPPPDASRVGGLVRALVQLEDQHVALAGASAGGTETLGALFRTATDGSVVVWRVFDPAAEALKEGDRIDAIDGVPVRAWLRRTAELTFGGNRRGRYAEAATELGLAAAVVHRVAGLGPSVRLLVAPVGRPAHSISLHYLAVDRARAVALSRALDRTDLPRSFVAAGYRIGTVRIGAFAPQYDPAFVAASDAAARGGADDDRAMLAGYCAVVSSFAARFDAAAQTSDAVLVDLRGNLGGFGREARLMADAIDARKASRTFDVFATGRPGIVRLREQPVDSPCHHATQRRPILVLDDAATRSSGELMTTWLWSAGARVIGEHTVGAGGGFAFGSDGFALPGSSYRIRTSGNFTFFDASGLLRDGDWNEQRLVDIVSSAEFRPSLKHPFAIQSVGFRPDVTIATAAADLRDGGVGEVARALAAMERRGTSPVRPSRSAEAPARSRR